MYRKSLGLLALAASALALATPASAEWHRAETKHFIAFSESSEGDLRTKLQRLERFDAMMRQLFKVDDTVKVTLFVLPSIGDIQELAKNRNIGGFYNASAQLAYAFVPEKLNAYREGYTAETVLMHEYAHHMLLGGTDRYVPLWATEGLATMFMTARFDGDGGITLGAPNPTFSQAVYSGSRWTVEELLQSDTEKFGSDERIELYTRGWALAHYLWLSGKRPGEYVEFLKLLNKSGKPVESGRKAFGDLGALDREINAYLRRSGFPAAKFSADKIDAPTQVSIREATPGENAILQFRMESLIGVDKERSLALAREARPVGGRYPDDPFVQRTMAEIEYDAAVSNDLDYDLAEMAADRALAADPENLKAMAYKGRIAAQRARAGDQGSWALSRRWFLKANKLDPNDPLPFVLYYDSFRASGEVAPEGAVGGLYRAVVLMPQDLDLRARAAIELIRSGELERARTVLAPAAFNPHVSQGNPMRKLIGKIDQGLNREGLLAYIGEAKFDRLYNEFLRPDAARELADDAKKTDAEGSGDQNEASE